jgi:hypothetical protein
MSEASEDKLMVPIYAMEACRAKAMLLYMDLDGDLNLTNREFRCALNEMIEALNLPTIKPIPNLKELPFWIEALRALEIIHAARFN